MRKLLAVAALGLVGAFASGCATGFINKPPSAVTDTSATVNGFVWTTDGGEGSYWVEYGTTTAYDRKTTHHTAQVAEDTPHDASIPLAGLSPATVWHYRLCARDAQAGTCSKDATLFTGDSVSGRATDCLEEITVEECFHPTFVDVDARSGPSGASPTGSAEWFWHVGTNSFFGDAGPVSCLAVSGDTAIVAFRGVPNARTVARVTDGGSAKDQDSFEVVTQFDLSGNPLTPFGCSTFPTVAPGGDTVRRSGVNDLGDIVVVDAAP